MPKNTRIRFEKQYRETLRLHLAQSPPASAGAGRQTGREAAALGLDRLDLVRLHEQAMATLTKSSPPVRIAGRKSPMIEIGVFLRRHWLRSPWRIGRF